MCWGWIQWNADKIKHDRDHYVERDEARAGGALRTGIVTLQVEVRGARSVAKLAARLSEIEGVTSVLAGFGLMLPIRLAGEWPLFAQLRRRVDVANRR